MNNIYVYILAMSLATYLIRVLPLTLIRKEINNKLIKSLLYYVNYVILAWKGGNLFQVAVTSCVLVFIVELIIH